MEREGTKDETHTKVNVAATRQQPGDVLTCQRRINTDDINRFNDG